MNNNLPTWLKQRLKALESMPTFAARLPIWLPTITAAWRVAQTTLTLSAALRGELNKEGPMSWPDELMAELILTLGQLLDALPSPQEALPTAADLVELGVRAADNERAQSLVIESLGHLELMAQRLLARLFEIAFLAPTSKESTGRASHLLRLLTRLEELLDRLLQIWITKESSRGTSP